MTGAPRPTILAGMSPAETAGLSVADIIAHVSALGSTIAALGIWFFGFVMWGQNRSRAAQAARDAKATQAIMDALKDALKDAAEDRKAMREQAAEDRKAMREQAAEDRKAISVIAQAALQTAQAATQEMTKAAEEREKTSVALGLQIQALETLVTLAKSPDDSRGPAKWGGPSQTDPAE